MHSRPGLTGMTRRAPSSLSSEPERGSPLIAGLHKTESEQYVAEPLSPSFRPKVRSGTHVQNASAADRGGSLIALFHLLHMQEHLRYRPSATGTPEQSGASGLRLQVHSLRKDLQASSRPYGNHAHEFTAAGFHRCFRRSPASQRGDIARAFLHAFTCAAVLEPCPSGILAIAMGAMHALPGEPDMTFPLASQMLPAEPHWALHTMQNLTRQHLKAEAHAAELRDRHRAAARESAAKDKQLDLARRTIERLSGERNLIEVRPAEAVCSPHSTASGEDGSCPAWVVYRRHQTQKHRGGLSLVQSALHVGPVQLDSAWHTIDCLGCKSDLI